LLSGAAMLLFTPEARADDPKLEFTRYKLENGLEVILHQDKSVPLVAVDVWYHVGSGDEVAGKSGFAHLFEHMMFQGSVHTGEDVHFDTLKKIGAGTVNGSTNSTRTNYYEVVPSHHLETALWLESDRMGYMLPLLNETSLGNQREVVRNERRQNYDTRPYTKDRFAVQAALYGEGHPYRYLTIGLHEDLARASADDVRAFFRKWYVPANATLLLAGDFEIEEAKKLVEKWFGNFPKSEKPAHKVVAPTPITATKRETVTDDFAKLRRVHYAWHTPKFYAAGDAELDILAGALGREGTGRLYKILKHDKQLVQNVSVYQSSGDFSSSFHVVADLDPAADQKEVEKIITDEIAAAMKTPISKRELDREVTQVESALVWGLEGLLSRAELLQGYNHTLGDPASISYDLDRYRKATPEGVRDVAAKYLRPENRVEIITVPGAKEGK
jgi:zinc protease